MSARMPSILVDYNAFLRDDSYAGLCNEVNLPTVAVKTIDQSLAGVGGDIERSIGKLEKMEAVVTITDYASKVMDLIGDRDSRDEVIMLRGHMDTDSGEITCIVRMQGFWKSLEFGDGWKPEAEATTKFTIAVDMFELELDGKQVLFIDKFNNDFIVNGKNRNQKLKASLAQ
ncbi:hypothetical protein GZ77_26570 [Endozoicomonas montiporae]|uniref:Phage major tail tube protein n=1 Tax=Endozoicomonas montiporae TaxID=1027273 RepID=A0A081MYF2_9GAMM|nr:phage major tail tube protein [Endozoicomonas montiporae]KEQ11225.1 hypothetical protein GZ77_26570 [Endozoicomonas montiporae]